MCNIDYPASNQGNMMLEDVTSGSISFSYLK